ncbi:hypothetical protein FRC14_007052 [Serendipita sp. 396]|nr:hypothetical protein FRC14_007052 [Serendipita sp. 396]
MKWAVKLAPLHPFSDRAPMAEAIGLRPSIVGLVELSSAALQSCHDYVAKVKQVSDDVQSVISEVALLRSILEQRYRLISDRKDEKKELTLEITRSPAWSIQSIIQDCLLSPLRGTELDDLLWTLGKYKTSFILAITGDQAKVTLNIETTVNNVSGQLEDMKMSESRKEVLQWLKGSDLTTNHDTALKKHGSGTGKRLLDSKEFKSWMEEDGKILWLNGIPGAGKTVLSSTVIEHLISECKSSVENRMAYYYFDFREHGKQTASDCLRSLVHQLCEQSERIPRVVQDLYTECKGVTPSLSQPTMTLIGLFEDGSKYFIVIDALDECREEEEEHERELFFEALQEIVSSASGRYSIFIASRPEVDISQNLTDLDAINFNIQHNLINADIHSHVRACLEKEVRFKKWPSLVKTQIEEIGVRC